MEMRAWRDGWGRAEEATRALKVALEGLGVPEGRRFGCGPP